MNDKSIKPSELKRLLENRCIPKTKLAKLLNTRVEYITHSLNPKSKRYKTAKIEETKTRLYNLLINTKLGI